MESVVFETDRGKRSALVIDRPEVTVREYAPHLAGCGLRRVYLKRYKPELRSAFETEEAPELLALARQVLGGAA